MANLSSEFVKRLARYREKNPPVVSMYLNVDGKSNVRTEDYLNRMETLLREASKKHPEKTVALLLERIEAHASTNFERGNARGLAVFASDGELWETISLPVPVEDQIIINNSPHIRQLETILDEYKPSGVLITDKQKARLFVIELGQVVERREVVDPLPRHDDDKGDWRKDHVKAHASVSAQHHFRNAAQAMFDLYQQRHFDHLALGVAEEAKTVLEKELHDYLRSKVAGVVNLAVSSSEDEIVLAVHDLVVKAEQGREAEFIERLRAGIGNAHAVCGIEETLRALFDKRVNTLLVSRGFTKEGWRCVGCGCIATVGRKCPMCGLEMTHVEDVVEEAVEDALAQKCHVEFCSENADLDVLGRIAALLRF